LRLKKARRFYSVAKYSHGKNRGGGEECIQIFVVDKRVKGPPSPPFTNDVWKKKDKKVLFHIIVFAQVHFLFFTTTQMTKRE
tara:strand:- start:38 stop:283 length:246 start_codon:yes stop_codon:yes gene_type:complete